MILKFGDDGVVSSVNEEDLIYVDKNELEQFVESYHQLEKENKLLKSDNNRLVNETAKIIAEHQGRVFEIIDERINEYIYTEKLYKHKGKDREASVFNLYCLCLNNLKKELQE